MNNVTHIEDAKRLVPAWTLEDFEGDEPYVYMYSAAQENGPFIYEKILGAAARQAKEAGYGSDAFKRTLKAYFQSVQKPVLGVNATNFPEQENVLGETGALICGEYSCDENGIRYRGSMGQTVQVISHPIMPIKRIENVDTREHLIQIAFRRGNSGWRTQIEKAETLASSQRIVALSRTGIAVTTENAKELVTYFDHIVGDNYDRLPAQRSTSHLGWLTDGTFMPYSDDIEYDGADEGNAKRMAAFREKGSFDEWLRIAKATRSGKSVPARIALAGSFASPLCSRVGGLPFILHFHGQTSMGKSVALMLSASVWGEPSINGDYVIPFRSTTNALETMAAFLNNVPMHIDELQMVNDRKSFDDIIYMLCEGSSKPRATRDGGLQQKRNWNNTILTTGEFPIVKPNSGGGAVGRTIEVGFGGKPLFEDGRAVANALKENFGFAGKIFTNAMKEQGIITDARDEVDAIAARFRAKDVQDKQALSAAILIVADEMADRFIFHDGMSLTEDDIMPYLTTNAEADVNGRAWQWVMGMIASNPKRFESEDNNGELWGVKEGNKVFFIKTVFDRLLAAEGYAGSTFLEWAKRNNRIECDQYGPGTKNNRLTKRKRIGGQYVPCVVLITEDEGFIPVENDEDLPFMQ